MTKIYLIRHGESIGNASRIYLGHTDLDLSPLGYLQADETAKCLSEVPFSAIYASDLMRAVHTAEPHAKMRNLSVIPTRELREMNVGEWEGARVDDLVLDERFTKGWRENFGFFTFPGGENVQGAAERIFSFASKTAASHDGKTIAFVFHAAAIRAFWCKILDIPVEDWATTVRFPTNASYSILEYENGTFNPIAYSCDDHLATVTKLP